MASVRKDDHSAEALAPTVDRNHRHAVHRIVDVVSHAPVDLVAMLRDIRDAPGASATDDAPHGRSGRGDALARVVGEHAAGGSDLDGGVRVHETECGTVSLREVCGSLEESLQHTPRIELQRDLLAEPPHALNDTL